MDVIRNEIEQGSSVEIFKKMLDVFSMDDTLKADAD